MIGGEGPESEYWVSHDSLAWMTYAKAVGANVFDLEHRYYGESKLGTQNVKQNLTGPWITFGGSYPGALAAWSREWFPELIIGAVGSSGPVLAKNDFYEDVIKRQATEKQGTPKCNDRTVEAFETLHKLSQSPDGRATISEKFLLEPPWVSGPNAAVDDIDMDNVFSALVGLYMGTVQYNWVDWSDVQNICSFFEDDSRSSIDSLRVQMTLTFSTTSIC
ncbi:hypothetical protein PMAYCL1PPCAC_16234 [Pristionchus mayeri]|uniref:Peptidase n=1 Tax=Pristionchus mayeri TaxID=1317129 RepID=A0AAN5CKD6_9BILA|nr:hypothetical protein PMAYCL1PPCAC_16234 [Pristionchus mayeri]